MMQPQQHNYERSEDSVCISSLEVISGLGHGGFGCVVLVVDKTTDRKYAMKMISKQIGSGRTIDKLRIEREAVALAMPNSLFLQKCYAEFQSFNNVFFVLEYIEGLNT
jgi:serine/threonine protein kinase